jgi:putative transposase
MCQSFFATSSAHCSTATRFRSHSEARMAAFHFIEGFYNPTGRHSALRRLLPIDVERKCHDKNEPT